MWSTKVTSNSTSDYFVHASDLPGGSFSLTLQPGYVYTLSTTTGAGKGSATSPAAGSFALPYTDSYDGYGTGQEAKYLADMQGAFEIVGCGAARRPRLVQLPGQLGRAARTGRVR